MASAENLAIRKANWAPVYPLVAFADHADAHIPDFTEEELKQARSHIPEVDEHMHLCNAGASPTPQPVLDAYTKILMREQLIGGYAAADEARADLQHTKEAVSAMINADGSENIALVDSATTAWIRAFYSILFNANDVILTCEAEYAANYVAMLQVAKRTGAEVQVVASAEDGCISLVDMEARLKGLGSRVEAICILTLTLILSLCLDRLEN